MKCFTISVFVLALTLTSRADDLVASATETSETSQQLSGAESSSSPLQEKHQEKRYVGGYAGLGGYGVGLDSIGGGYGGYYNPYQSRFGLDGYSGYPGYNGYYSGLGGYSAGGYGGYGGYGAYNGGYSPMGAGVYGSYPYNSYNSYNRFGGAYPYARPGYAAYSSYPSSYYSSHYGNSFGAGFGALGSPGFVPPVGGAAGYHYGLGYTGTVY